MEFLYEFSFKKTKVDHVDKKQECELTNFRKGKAMEEFGNEEVLGKHSKGEVLGKHSKEEVLGIHSKAYVNFAFDETDTREYVHSDFADTKSGRYGSSVDVQNFEEGENEDEETLKIPVERKMSEITQKAMVDKKRSQGLVDIRKIVQENSFSEDDIDQIDLQILLLDTNFSLAFFDLFDAQGLGTLDQPSWFGQLRYWAKVKFIKKYLTKC